MHGFKNKDFLMNPSKYPAWSGYFFFSSYFRLDESMFLVKEYLP